MANGKKPPPPAALHQDVIKTLLDRLTDDQDFRDLFQRNPSAALSAAGYVSAGECLRLAEGTSLASPDKIKDGRAKLEAALSAPFSFQCPVGLKAD